MPGDFRLVLDIAFEDFRNIYLNEQLIKNNNRRIYEKNTATNYNNCLKLLKCFRTDGL